MSILIAIDGGLKGCISIFEDGVLDALIDMPTKELLIKPARYKYKHKDPKILVKSGKNAGQRAKVIKTPAKKKTVIDFEAINKLIVETKEGEDCKVIIEKVGFMRMNSGTLRKIENHGILKGLFIAQGLEPEEVAAITWKRALKVTSDKETSLRLAAKLFYGWAFSRDDEAEAALIGYWWLNHKGVKK